MLRQATRRKNWRSSWISSHGRAPPFRRPQRNSESQRHPSGNGSGGEDMMEASGNKPELPEPPAFQTTYPAITRWVKDHGNVEFGYDRDTGTFVRATDESGVRFGGGDRFGTIDDALRALE